MYLVMEACPGHPAPRRDDGPRSTTPPSLRLPPVTTTVEATPLSVQKEDPIRAIKVKNSARIWPWPRWKGTRWGADFKSHRKHTRHRGSQHCRSTLTGWLSRWAVKGDPNNHFEGIRVISEAATYLDITLERASCTLIVYFKREADTRIERSVAI